MIETKWVWNGLEEQQADFSEWSGLIYQPAKCFQNFSSEHLLAPSNTD